MSFITFAKKYSITLQFILLLWLFFPKSSHSQEKFILTQEDLPDFVLAYQSIYEGRIYQQWKKNNENYSLYLFYYEYKDEYTSIKEISDRSGSFAALYIFGFPNGQILGNSSWTSVSRTAAFIQLWNVGVQIVERNGEIVTNVADKLLTKIQDSISAEYLVKDSELKKLQISLDNCDEVIGAATDTLADNGFEEFKVEDSKWIFNADSLVMGFRKQWSGENSFFSIDVCEFSSVDDAQQAAEQNANIKRSPFFLIDDEASLEQAIEHWNYYWSVNDTIKYISVVSRTGKYAIHFYFFDEYGIDIELFKQVILATTQMGTGISNSKTDAIKVYPNPADDFITITTPTYEPEKYLLVVRNIRGRQVILKNIELSGSYRLSISELPQGIYFITIQNESMRVDNKIIVQ